MIFLELQLNTLNVPKYLHLRRGTDSSLCFLRIVSSCFVLRFSSPGWDLENTLKGKAEGSLHLMLCSLSLRDHSSLTCLQLIASCLHAVLRTGSSHFAWVKSACISVNMLQLNNASSSVIMWQQIHIIISDQSCHSFQRLVSEWSLCSCYVVHSQTAKHCCFLVSIDKPM